MERVKSRGPEEIIYPCIDIEITHPITTIKHHTRIMAIYITLNSFSSFFSAFKFDGALLSTRVFNICS